MKREYIQEEMQNKNNKKNIKCQKAKWKINMEDKGKVRTM